MEKADMEKTQDKKDSELLYLRKTDGQAERKKIIDFILEDVTYIDSDTDQDIVLNKRKLLENIIEMIRIDIDVLTIVVEFDHIDASYTDTFYNHFAGLHFEPSKYCKRLSFFQGEVTSLSFLKEELKEELQSSILGTMIIRPLKYGFIGRTLLNPKKISKGISDDIIYLRLAEFRQHILGMEFRVDAFPFCSQDSCFMTCAEVSIMNLMEYFSMRYHIYRAVLPNDIKRLAQQYQYERVTPSKGLTYLVVSKILSEFGFTPRLYNTESIMKYPLVGDERENEIKRIMHYYIESGIPVAVNVEPRKGELREGHSLLCIGHSDRKDAERAERYSISGRWEDHAVINSADFYTQYCVIDDHQKPYEIRDYREISTFSNMWISNLAVPLNKKMYLEAKYAYDIFYRLFRDPNLGLAYWNVPDEYLAAGEMVVMRIYQASSRNYKEFKVNSYDDLHIVRKAEFASIKFPQFIWCCEFFSYSEYMKDNRQAFAEIILDATAAFKDDYESALLVIETFNQLITKVKAKPHDQLAKIHFFKYDEEDMLIPVYDRNLDKSYEPSKITCDDG